MFWPKAHLEYAAASATSKGTLEGVAFQISKESSKKCNFCINLNIKYSKICFLKKNIFAIENNESVVCAHILHNEKHQPLKKGFF